MKLDRATKQDIVAMIVARYPMAIETRNVHDLTSDQERTIQYLVEDIISTIVSQDRVLIDKEVLRTAFNWCQGGARTLSPESVRAFQEVMTELW